MPPFFILGVQAKKSFTAGNGSLGSFLSPSLVAPRSNCAISLKEWMWVALSSSNPTWLAWYMATMTSAFLVWPSVIDSKRVMASWNREKHNLGISFSTNRATSALKLNVHPPMVDGLEGILTSNSFIWGWIVFHSEPSSPTIWCNISKSWMKPA